MKRLSLTALILFTGALALGSVLQGCSGTSTDPDWTSSKAIVLDAPAPEGTPIGTMDEATGEITFVEGFIDGLLPGTYTFVVVDELGEMIGIIEIEVAEDGTFTVEFEDEDSESEASLDEASEESLEESSVGSEDSTSEGSTGQL